MAFGFLTLGGSFILWKVLYAPHSIQRLVKQRKKDPLTDYSHLLKALKFSGVAGRWQRRFDYPATGEYVITVDTDKRTIEYPKPVVLGDRTTSNFDQPENFVVLECVCRLLSKGYDPATLILEKRYQLGRGASGGKSDITVLRRTTDPEAQRTLTRSLSSSARRGAASTTPNAEKR